MRLRIIAVTAASAVGLSLAVAAAPAEAATSLTIKKIATKTAPYKKSVTVKPSVAKKGNISIKRSSLSVSRKGKSVAKDRTSVKLKAGSYRVTTKVRYRTFSKVKKNVVTVPAGERVFSWSEAPDGMTGFVDCEAVDVVSQDDFDVRCGLEDATVSTITVPNENASLPDWNTPETDGDSLFPDWLVTSEDLYRAKTVTQYSGYKTKQRTQSLTVRQGRKPASCATYGNYRKVREGMSVTQVRNLLGPGKVTFSSSGVVNREYKPCNRVDFYAVMFDEGQVYDKFFADFS